MDCLDDFICEIQSDELPEELFYEPSDLAEQEYYNFETNYKVGRTAAERRKNDWKYANRRKNVLNNYGIESNKPLHYYSKNVLKHKNFKVDRILHNERQIDNFENQLKELFDEE